MLAGALNGSCEAAVTGHVNLENKLNQKVSIYFPPDETEQRVLQPLQKVRLSLLKRGYHGRLLARATDGTIVFDSTLTWDQIDGSTIVLEQQ
jgi:hypothetical protein